MKEITALILDQRNTGIVVVDVQTKLMAVMRRTEEHVR